MLADLRAAAYRRDEGAADNEYDLDALRRRWLEFCGQSLRRRSALRYRQNLDNVFGSITARRVSQLSIDAFTAYRRDCLPWGRRRGR